jgi:flagellar hook-associated protein 2
MASVDGLVSGLNTSEIIAQLMQLERQPQVRLQSKQKAVESAISALRDLNTKFLSITTAAAKLNTATGWQLATATSSDATRVAASATSGATQSSLTFSVEQLAKASTSLSAGFVSSTTASVATANTSIFLTKGSAAAVEIDTGDGSLGAVVNAVNKAGAGVTASAVQTTTGEYRLHLASTTTGADTAISIKDGAGANPFAATLGTQDAVVVGQDAKLLLGTSTVTRASNTISDLMTGVTLTLTKAETGVPVTVAVKSDAEGLAANVSALVDAVNLARSDMKALTTYNLETKAKGKLYGDSSIRSLRGGLADAVIGDGATSAGIAGVTVERDGTVKFDKTKFLAAMAEDPVAVEKALGADGMAGRLHSLADGASRGQYDASGPGLIHGAITSRESQITGLKTSISSLDNRLELRQLTLQRQFASLEKALGAAQSQGQWLAGQIAGLPGWGG